MTSAWPFRMASFCWCQGQSASCLGPAGVVAALSWLAASPSASQTSACRVGKLAAIPCSSPSLKQACSHQNPNPGLPWTPLPPPPPPPPPPLSAADRNFVVRQGRLLDWQLCKRQPIIWRADCNTKVITLLEVGMQSSRPQASKPPPSFRAGCMTISFASASLNIIYLASWLQHKANHSSCTRHAPICHQHCT